jgi:hypothetical protein
LKADLEQAHASGPLLQTSWRKAKKNHFGRPYT